MRNKGPRLIVSSAAMIAVLVSTLAVISILMHRKNLMYQARQHANQLSEISKRSLYDSMPRHERAVIERTIVQIGQVDRIERIRLINKSGEVIYASNLEDIGIVLGTDHVGCVQCHASSPPVSEIAADDRLIEVRDGPRRLFEVVTPIHNAPACSRDPCHGHPTDQNVLGVLTMRVNLPQVEDQMARSAILVICFTIAILLLSSFIAFCVHRFILRPMTALMQGVKRVSAGDLDHHITVDSDTEIGELAIAFNQMTLDLKKARQEIEEWGHSLKDQVAERIAQLEKTQAEPIQIQKLASMGKLAASVAHEINNPLMGVLTFVRTFQGWIASGAFPTQKFEEFSQDLEIMGKETMRISKIVRNLLAFARRSRLEKREQEINELLERSLQLLNHRLSLAGIDIYMHLAPDLPTLYIDAGQIQQAFMNLMLNAAEAMGDGGILTITSALTEDCHGISVRVEDNGSGIPPEIMDKIFDPFFTTKEVGQGTGLGLPVAYGIVHKHGGTMNVTSEIGVGTEFEVVLPISSASDDEVDNREEI